jgi:hypothetical protein
MFQLFDIPALRSPGRSEIQSLWKFSRSEMRPLWQFGRSTFQLFDIPAPGRSAVRKFSCFGNSVARKFNHSSAVVISGKT